MYEAEKSRLYTLIEGATGLARTRVPVLERIAERRAFEARMEVGLDGSAAITHPISDLIMWTWPLQGTYKGVWENAMWEYRFLDPVHHAFDAWNISPAHHANLFRADAVNYGLGIYTEMPPGSTNELDRRWYFICEFTKEIILNAVVVNSTSTVDQSLGATLAAKTGGVLYLTEADHLNLTTKNALLSHAPDKILIVGGTGVVSTAVEQQLGAIATTRRVGGANRFSTAVAIAQYQG